MRGFECSSEHKKLMIVELLMKKQLFNINDLKKEDAKELESKLAPVCKKC